jgi:hypothetical protein
MNPSWQSVSRDFEPDGSLRDIYVSPATLDDWQRTLDFLRQRSTEPSYSLDAQPLPLPVSVAEAFSARMHASALLTFRFGSIHFATHFFTDDELEFDFCPSDICAQTDLDSLLSFVQRIGDLLARPVSITPENSREDAFLVYQPDSHEFCHTPRAFNRNA